jgi:opacity protein-like surface antigen
MTPRLHASAALAAVLLAVPVAGLAQPKSRATASAPKPAATPAPPPAPVQEVAPFDERGPWRAGVVVGFENDSEAELKGPRVQVELERDLVPLGARGQLSFVAAAGWFLGLRSDSIAFGGFTTTTDTTQHLIEVVPAFRASFALKPRLRLFAEMGVGGGWATATTDVKVSPGSLPSTSTSADHGFGVLRLAAGASYQLNDRLRLGVLLPAWSKRYGHEATSSTLSFSALAAYAF